MLNLAYFIGVSVYVAWYVVVVTTMTCRQLGNDMTYDTEKKNPTSHDVADTSAVSGQRVGKTRRHVVETNCGRHIKQRHFQLSELIGEADRAWLIDCICCQDFRDGIGPELEGRSGSR